MTGKFVVIEGLDATGKSTLVQRLAACLNATPLKTPMRKVNQVYSDFSDKTSNLKPPNAIIISLLPRFRKREACSKSKRTPLISFRCRRNAETPRVV